MSSFYLVTPKQEEIVFQVFFQQKVNLEKVNKTSFSDNKF
jgi:hypothetical protein